MTDAEGSSGTGASTLLRKQVFDNPGAAEWLRAASTDRRGGIALGLLGILGALALGLALANIAHVQVRDHQVRVEGPGGACVNVPRCARVRWIETGAAEAPERVLLRVPGQAPQPLQILAVAPGTDGGGSRLQVLWPTEPPAAGAATEVSLERRHSLLGWMLPVWRRYEERS
ncbi:hypothetical protein [Stenotrophomonas maltophilia]|uniref:hypothetical protein n=1 Tax=Stenotrophomonas maltophilia TaxID=40324 RepID=UPI000D0BB32C|nr:hypothetical protein [Stenotrophomonas maltophilia]AVO32155.1 hypothetical protein C6Y55_20565 [Stenotrophomonas maltophilia]